LSRESTRSAAPWIARKKTLHSTHHRHHPQGQRVAGDKVVGRLALDPEVASDAEGEREHHDDPYGGPVACAMTMRSGENERERERESRGVRLVGERKNQQTNEPGERCARRAAERASLPSATTASTHQREDQRRIRGKGCYRRRSGSRTPPREVACCQRRRQRQPREPDPPGSRPGLGCSWRPQAKGGEGRAPEQEAQRRGEEKGTASYCGGGCCLRWSASGLDCAVPHSRFCADYMTATRRKFSLDGRCGRGRSS